MPDTVYIFIGAKKPENGLGNPGGQLTASIGLNEYATLNNFRLIIIDTLQPSFPVPPVLFRLMRGMKRVYQLICILLTKKVNGIIIFSSAGLSFYERMLMALISRFYGIKTIFFMRSGLFVGEINNSRIKRFISKWLLKIPNLIAMQGDSWRAFFDDLGVPRSKMLTVRNWPSGDISSDYQPINMSSNSRIRFCFVGWLVKEKGVIELFEAIKLLANKYNFEFVFVGGGSLQSQLENEIKTNKLQSYVRVTGWLSPKEVHQNLRDSHVFVLPSWAEGFPNTLLEAMAFGLPAICTNVGGVSDSLINEHNGFLLADSSIKSIAEAMQNYILLPELVCRHSVATLEIFHKQHNKEQNCGLIFQQFSAS